MFSPQLLSIIPPLLLQTSLISPGLDFNSICHPLLFSADTPALHPLRIDFSVFPPLITSLLLILPPPSPAVCCFFSPSTLLLITCQSLTSPPLFSLRCVWSLTALPFPCFPGSTSLFLCSTSPSSFIFFRVLPVFIIHICNLFHQAQAH